MPEFDFHGVKVGLPHSGRGSGSLSNDTLTWQRDSLTLTLQELQDGSVQIRRNGTAIGSARPGQSVRFTDDGQIESQK
jgi:hypothetical protein